MYQSPLFPEPEAFNYGSDLIKIPGLDGNGKMGKSENNGIFLIDDEATITKKVKKAVTGMTPTEPNSPMTEEVNNLFTIMKVVSSQDTIQFYRDKYNSGEIRYGDMKKQLAEDICKLTLPIRERILEILKDDEYLRKVAKMGAEKHAKAHRKQYMS